VNLRGRRGIAVRLIDTSGLGTIGLSLSRVVVVLQAAESLCVNHRDLVLDRGRASPSKRVLLQVLDLDASDSPVSVAGTCLLGDRSGVTETVSRLTALTLTGGVGRVFVFTSAGGSS